MIKDHEFLDLAVKNAQRNVDDCIERSCERHLREYRVQFLPKIEQVSTYMHTYQDYLDTFNFHFAAAQMASNQYNMEMQSYFQNQSAFQRVGNIFGVW